MKRYEIKFSKPDKNYSRELQIWLDGELLDSYWDRGEPEDNSFLRDYSWISKELEKAYNLGYEHALEAERYGDAKV